MFPYVPPLHERREYLTDEKIIQYLYDTYTMEQTVDFVRMLVQKLDDGVYEGKFAHRMMQEFCEKMPGKNLREG